MEAFLIYLLKVSGLIVLFWLFYQLLLKKETFFMANRWFLIIGLMASLCLPLLYLTKVVWVDPMPLPPWSTTNFEIVGTPLKEENFSWPSLLYTIYFLGILFFGSRFMVQLNSLRQLILKSDRRKIGNIGIVESNKNITPFSFFRDIIYNPEGYSNKELQTIIAHEKIHIEQFHSLDILFTHVILIFQWFNPFMWLYKSALKQNLEFIADQGVTLNRYPKKEYQYLLLKTSTNCPDYSFTNPFFNSFIKKRIVMLNSRKSNKASLFKYGLMVPLLVGFTLFFNTKIVAKTKNSATGTSVVLKAEQQESKSRLYTIAKNTTDDELDSMIQEIKDEEGELHIEKIKRDNKGLIIEISIVYDTKDGGKITGNSADKNGISDVYFGISEEGGAFICFDKKAVPSIMEGKPYYRPMKGGEESSSSYTRANAKGNSITTHVKRVMKNGKETLYVNGKESTEEELNKLGIYTEKTPQKKDSIRVLGYYHPQGRSGFPINPIPDTIAHSNTRPTHNGYSTITSYDDKGNKIVGTASHVILNLPDDEKPYVLLNGVEMPITVMDTLSPGTVKSITVVRSEEGVRTYGEKAKHGAVIVTMKSPVDIQIENLAKKSDFSAIIHKNTSDKALKRIQTDMLENKLDITYDKIERNKKNEIVKIKISVDDNLVNRSGSATFSKNDNPIPNILVGRLKGMIRITSNF